MEKDTSIEWNAEKEKFMLQGIDSRAMLVTMIRKLPVLLILAVAGAVLGSGLNLLVTLIKARDVAYISETEYYIEFAEGRYEARDYYNDFTWNDVLSTDLILGRAMELLGDGYEREQVKSMITADILSDVRYLTITVRGQEPDTVAAVKNALQTALEEFGAKKREFDSIEKIEDLPIVQEQVPCFVWRAAFLGAVIAAVAGIFVIAFRFCLGSAFYTKAAITETLGLPVYAMTFHNKNEKQKADALTERQTKMLEQNFKMLTAQYDKVLLLDATEGQDAAIFLQRLKNDTGVDTTKFEQYDMQKDEMAGAAILAVIPFGKTYKEKITDEMNYVRLHGGDIVGAVLAETDKSWAKIYYACMVKRK